MAADRPALVVFLSDYGLDDPFVGLCHAVIAGLAPGTRVIDLSHAVPPHAVREGALLLADSLPWLPPGAVLLAVVDPGVGPRRRGLVLAAGAGDARKLLVGPDNGLLLPAAEAAGGVSGAWELPPARSASVTFDGRDVFAPAAARLAAGAAPGSLGAPVPHEGLAGLTLGEAEVAPGRLRGEVGHVDRFGNLQLLARAHDLAGAGLTVGTGVSVAVGTTTLAATIGRTFADVPPGQVAVLPDAFGRVQVAVNQGDAAGALDAAPGDTVVVERRPRARAPDA
jgi:hypothetical protein